MGTKVKAGAKTNLILQKDCRILQIGYIAVGQRLQAPGIGYNVKY